MDGLVRGAAPPASMKKLQVFRVTTTETNQFTCCSSFAFGQWIHWFGRRSHECKKDTGRCKGCEESWPTKWKGYLHVIDPTGKHEGFLEITATCWNLIVTLVPDRSNLRGIRFRLSRTKGGAKGRYLVDVLEARCPENSLPVEKDPLQTLRYLWNAKKGPSTES